MYLANRLRFDKVMTKHQMDRFLNQGVYAHMQNTVTAPQLSNIVYMLLTFAFDIELLTGSFGR